jgi:hypothetical protein
LFIGVNIKERKLLTMVFEATEIYGNFLKMQAAIQGFYLI